jgi:hypothetical protein
LNADFLCGCIKDFTRARSAQVGRNHRSVARRTNYRNCGTSASCEAATTRAIEVLGAGNDACGLMGSRQ